MPRPSHPLGAAVFAPIVARGSAAGCARVHDAPEQAVADACGSLGPSAATGRVKRGPAAGTAVVTAVAAGGGVLAAGGMFAMAVGGAPRVT